MININLIAVGKIKESFLREQIEEYKKRLSRYCQLNIIEVSDSKIKENASTKEEMIVLEEEGERILKKIKENELLILIDLHGKEMDSVNFANQFEKLSNKNSSIAIVIGGSLGLSDKLRKRSDFSLCLSKMTFTHQMTRVIVLEQIYRAFKINNNEVYHK